MLNAKSNSSGRGNRESNSRNPSRQAMSLLSAHFKHGYCAIGTEDVVRVPLNQIERSPVVNANSDHVHQQVRSTQQPNVAISQYIAINCDAEGETWPSFRARVREPHFAIHRRKATPFRLASLGCDNRAKAQRKSLLRRQTRIRNASQRLS